MDEVQALLEDEQMTECAETGDLEEAAPEAEDVTANESPTEYEEQSPLLELQRLRAELDDLRAELLGDRGRLLKLSEELGELDRLFPDVKLSELPERVWTEVAAGTPLCAAVALEEKRRSDQKKKAALSNLENRLRSVGCPERGKTDLYSPEEVRAMTPAEVRKNYTAIVRSMQKW